MIVEGLRSLHFGASCKGATNLGSVELCEGMVALRDKLTAESVAWVCIAVSSLLILQLTLDLVNVMVLQ